MEIDNKKYGETRIIEGKMGGLPAVYRMTDILDDDNDVISYRYTMLDPDTFEPEPNPGDDEDAKDGPKFTRPTWAYNIDEDDPKDTDKSTFLSNRNFITLNGFRVAQQQTGGRKRTRRRRRSTKRRSTKRRRRATKRRK
jgi:hypothetical protein